MLAQKTNQLDGHRNILKTRGIGENLFHLGTLLANGVPLPQALKEIAVVSDNSRLKSAAVRAAGQLASGLTCREVFAGNDTRVFTAFARYILATPLPDEIKGRLLADWNPVKGFSFLISRELFYAVQSLGIGLFCSLALIVFVFPQFREILYGFDLMAAGNGSSLIELLNYISESGTGLITVVGLVFLAAVIAASFVVIRVSKTGETMDELNLFRLLKSVKQQDRLLVIDLMAVPHNFPRLHQSLKKFTVELKNSGDISSSCRMAGISSFCAGSFIWHLSGNR
jgi:hypothetical protein